MRRFFVSEMDERAEALARKHALGLELIGFCDARRLQDAEFIHAQAARLEGLADRAVHAPYFELAPCAIDPLIRAVALHRMRQAAQVCGRLGVKRMIVHSGYAPQVYFPEWFVPRSVEFWCEFLGGLSADFELMVENVLDVGPEPLCAVIDGVNVYQSRVEAGRRLAMGDDVQADMVIGVPDSALAAAMGYAQQSGIPYGDGLAKNRYVGRTFIQPNQGMREVGVRTKLNAMTRNVRGKLIVLVDDSIVRGTTSRRIVEMLRTAGAREVHVRVSSPMVLHPCHFGIDIATSTELIGHGHSAEDICKFIGADSLKYLSLDDLRKTVEGAGCGLCTGCFDGRYPIDPETGEMLEG